MDDHQIRQASEHATVRAARYGLTAFARRSQPDDPDITFEAFSYQGIVRRTYIRSYPLDELRRLGAVALASEFVETARLDFPPDLESR